MRGYTLTIIWQGTNTYLVGTGASRLLIDTGEGKPVWASALASLLKSEKTTIAQALVTHWHPDHVGGFEQLLNICPKAKIYENDPPKGRGVEPIETSQIFKTEGASVKAFHCPGHTTNHMAFILEDEDAMFTGDSVLGHGTAVFEDLATYLQSLEKMKQQFKGRAYPGHGAVIEDGPAKIQEYIEHRHEREQQVVEQLKKAGAKGMTRMEIVQVLYHEYPQNLWEAASKGVLQILQKLEVEGRVCKAGEGRWKMKE